MAFYELFFDADGPLGLSREVWWTIISTGVLTGVLPVVWARAQASRAQPMLQHIGVMLSYDHGELGATIGVTTKQGRRVTADYNQAFDKIQNEIGLLGPYVASRSDLVKGVGAYLKAINDLWWWLDSREDPALKIPSRLRDSQITQETLAKKVDEKYKALMDKLRTEIGFRRDWFAA